MNSAVKYFSLGLILISFKVHSFDKPSQIQVPSHLLQKLKSFEPSGSLYLEDLDRYLIASDDTTKKNDPWLFLMDSKGVVDESPVVIEGVQKMTDIESISQDENGLLYILGSQSLNKNGKNLKERNLFLRAERIGRNIQVSDAIELRPLLLKALLDSSESEILLLRSQLEAGLDIESHFIFSGQLYLGFKNPQTQEGQALIVNMGSVDNLFLHQSLEKITLSKQINFYALSGHPDLLSEILKVGDLLFLTTTSEDSIGRLWSYNLKSEELKIIENYENLRPEAVAYNSFKSELLIFFDQGDEAALFQRRLINQKGKIAF